jgi:hypothetical protein
MKTITISDEAAKFIAEFTDELKKQDRRGTADPYYYVVRRVIDDPQPNGCGDRKKYFDHGRVENYTEEEAKRQAEERCMDFDDYVETCCTEYEVSDGYEIENVFFTKKGYDEHVALYGHNIIWRCNEKGFDSYIEHAYRNPEIAGLLKAVKEIGEALK